MILRKKYRYILAEASASVNYEVKALDAEMRKSLLPIMGIKSFAQANPHVVKTLSHNSFIIKTARGSEHAIILALAFIKEMHDSEIGIYTLRTSGTIRSILRYYAKAFQNEGAS
ncbi:MAG: Rpp14/Pop5 family protein [Candidatus Micrarchaeaceae archaeon]